MCVNSDQVINFKVQFYPQLLEQNKKNKNPICILCKIMHHYYLFNLLNMQIIGLFWFILGIKLRGKDKGQPMGGPK